MTNGKLLTTVKTTAIVIIMSGAALIAACSDAGAPATSPRMESASDATTRAILKAQQTAASVNDAGVVISLLRDKPLAKDVVVSKTITSRDGGKIDVPGTDFRLEIPKNAFAASSMTITVRAMAGSAVAYDFEPHGSQFLVPLRYVQSLGHTNMDHLPPPPPGFIPQLRGAYFPSDAMVDPVTGVAVVTELLPTTTDITWAGNQVSFPIQHFSGYMVATGRQSSY